MTLKKVTPAQLILCLALCLIVPAIAVAHGDEDHEKKDTARQVETTREPQSDHHSSDEEHTTSPEVVDTMAPFSAFPNLHPLVVHFPIVLLILAFFTQLFGLFIMKKPLSRVTLALLLVGFITAWISTNFVHPHVSGLTEHAAKVLAEHEWFASVTLWSSGIALLLKTTSQFFLKLNIWMEVLVGTALFIAAGAVSLAGHHGAQLVHIEGIGPQGKYLESQSGHNHTH